MSAVRYALVNPSLWAIRQSWPFRRRSLGYAIIFPIFPLLSTRSVLFPRSKTSASESARLGRRRPLLVQSTLNVSKHRNTSAAGLVILLWDHILTFADEVQLVWGAKLSISKVLFLFNRYVVPFVMIVQSHEFSGTTPYPSLQFCKAWYAIGVVIGVLSMVTSNFLILLRLWVLWDRSPRLMLGTLTFFVVTQLVALSLTGYVINDMLPTLIFDPVLRICMPMAKPKLVMMWSPGIVFEFMIFLATVWNALDRPRSPNVRMTKILYRDRSLYFFGLFALRLVNILLCVAEPNSLTFMGVFFFWSVSNTTLARLILDLRRVSTDRGHANAGFLKCERELGDDDGGVKQIELPVLVVHGAIQNWTK